MKKEEKTYKNFSKTIHQMAIRTYILIIILSVRIQNAPTKRDRVAEWIKKTRPVYMLPTRGSLQIYRYIQFESELMERDFMLIEIKWKLEYHLSQGLFQPDRSLALSHIQTLGSFPAVGVPQA